MTNDAHPKPIDYPKRDIDHIREPVELPKFPLAGEGYHDPRETEQKKVRFEYDPEFSKLAEDPDYAIFSPEGHYIEVDSADDIKQNYTVPSSGLSYGQHTLAKYFIDPVNKILVVYHFDHENLRWMRFVTRLRKDVSLPQPPVWQMTHNAMYTFRSRGTRYVNCPRDVTKIRRREHTANRVYRNRAGISGARYQIGAFRGGFR